MFKHRFNPKNAHDFGNVIDAINLMTGRAKSTLNMLNSYIEGDSEDLHKHDVAGVVYCVLAELDDVDDVLNGVDREFGTYTPLRGFQVFN